MPDKDWENLMAADDDGNAEMDVDEFTIMIKDIFSGRHDIVRTK
jgi:hypothetical protein